MVGTKNIERSITAKFMGIVFLYMFIALFITAGTSALVGFLFTTFLPLTEETNQNIYLITLIVSFILIIGVGFWFSFAGYRSKGGLYVPFAIYAILMGILASTFTMFIEFEVLAISFGITCLAFLCMALIGIFTKKNLNFLLIVVFGLLLGCFFIGLTNIIWYFFFPTTFLINYLIIEVAVFAVIILITLFDVWRIKKIAERGEANNNLALYCAFNLYIDFINIFIRIVSLVSSSKRN